MSDNSVFSVNFDPCPNQRYLLHPDDFSPFDLEESLQQREDIVIPPSAFRHRINDVDAIITILSIYDRLDLVPSEAIFYPFVSGENFTSEVRDVIETIAGRDDLTSAQRQRAAELLDKMENTEDESFDW